MPGGITLLQSLNADIPTPPAGKITVYFSIDLGTPAYKNSAGVVTTLVGSAGATGAQGAIGPAGIAFDGEAGDFMISQPGPQGNQGVTGAQGPTGPMMVVEDGRDGEDGISVPASGSSVTSEFDILVTMINISDAELRSLNTVPKNLGIPAPGANKCIVPLKFQVMFELTSAFSANPNLNVRPVGGTSSHFTAQPIVINATLAKKAAAPVTAATQASINLTTTGQINTQWEVFGSSAPTGGSTTAGFNFYLWYSILSLP